MIHFLAIEAQPELYCFKIRAANSKLKTKENPTYPKYKKGGWIANRGSCKIGFNPSPEPGQEIFY